MLYLYNIGIYIYGAILRLASFLDPKAKELIHGRRNSLDLIRLKKANFPNAKWIWIHAASLGEFEQGRHLIDQIATDHSLYKIALSFYSPSGYLPRQNYKNADMVFYMPLDTRHNAKVLIDELSPQLAIFIKYDFWWNHLKALQTKSIPTIFISATIRPDQYFIKNKLGSIRSILSNVDHYYVQNQESADLLHSIEIRQTTVTGDSRLDSILSEQSKELAIHKEIMAWKGDQKCIIYGSIHLSDISVIKEMNSITVKHLIVPHDIDEANIYAIQAQLPEARVYSDEGLQDSSMVILDQTGVLRHIYNMADLVYIGGGFGKGIHNTLEPLVHLVPLLIGPNYGKFPEAIDLISVGAIKTIALSNMANQEANQLLMEPNTQRKLLQKSYLSKNSGATDQILSSLVKNQWMQKL